jgi:hypothetical protein
MSGKGETTMLPKKRPAETAEGSAAISKEKAALIKQQNTNLLTRLKDKRSEIS